MPFILMPRLGDFRSHPKKYRDRKPSQEYFVARIAAGYPPMDTLCDKDARFVRRYWSPFQDLRAKTGLVI